MAFCNWLSDREKRPPAYQFVQNAWQRVPGAIGYRLPTEAQWEYACRAGTKTVFASGNDPNSLALYSNVADQSARKKWGWYWAIGADDGNAFTAPVGTYQANKFGLFDMHGNVSEWCEDWYEDYGGNASDPRGPDSGKERILRGGGWSTERRHVRCAYRFHYAPSDRTDFSGFRVAISGISAPSG